MKKYCMLLLMFCLAGCASAAGTTLPKAADASPTAAEQSASNPSEPAAQETESADSAPTGAELNVMDELKPEIPWLDYDRNKVPAVQFLGINLRVFPLDQQPVRQALSYAVDRERLADGARASVKFFPEEVKPASTFTPSAVLGRDLYGEAGITLDADISAQKLSEAGYADGAGFPALELAYYASPSGEALASALIEDWHKYLNITIVPKPFQDGEAFYAYLEGDTAFLYIMSFIADYIDPKNFTRDFFQEYFYSNPGLEKMNTDAEALADDPQQRQRKYIEIEQMISGADAAVIPLFHFATQLQ